MKLINYESKDEFDELRTSMAIKYKEKIIANMFDYMDDPGEWESDCYDYFRKEGYKYWLEVTKGAHEQFCEVHSRAIAFGMVSTIKTYCKTLLYLSSPTQFWTPNDFNRENIIRLANETIDTYDDTNQDTWDEVLLNNFIFMDECDLQPRFKVQLAIAMALHRRLGSASLIQNLGSDILRMVCVYLHQA